MHGFIWVWLYMADDSAKTTLQGFHVELPPGHQHVALWTVQAQMAFILPKCPLPVCHLAASDVGCTILLPH